MEKENPSSHSAAILLSRQQLQPTSKQAWIDASSQAVQWVGHNGFTLITSTGMQTWEMLLFMAIKYELDQKIVVPSIDTHDFEVQCNWIEEQFNPDETKVEYVPLIYQNTKEKTFLAERDKFIVEEAQILIPVSVRKSGHMSSLIENADKEKKSVETGFKIDYEKRYTTLKYSLTENELNDQISKLGAQYLIHWTRSCSKAWPNETLRAYYEFIACSQNYPRDAFATLKNILSTGYIKASSRHIPDKTAIVSFTGQAPSSFIPLMRWRTRYVQMSFEPYGLGIKKDAALKYGLQKVIYTEKTVPAAHNDRWLFQSKGKRGNWQAEDEYRFWGDFNFGEIPKEELICFCLEQWQAEEILNKWKIRSIAFRV